MKLIRAGFQRNDYNPRRRSSTFRGISIRNHLEFLNRIHGRFDDFFLARMPGSNLLVVVIHSVEQKRSLTAGLSADADAAIGIAGNYGDSAGRKRCELQIVS